MSGPSVDGVCDLLARGKLLPPEQVRALRRRWDAEAGRGAGDVGAFAKWLVEQKHVTEYQAGLLLSGKAARFFVGAYKLLDRLGAGLFKGAHPLGQVVALRVLPPSRAKDPELLARFQREAGVAARLKHPNVVRTFQAARAGALHYLVLEYLDGRTLEEVLNKRGPLPPAEAAWVAHQALLGLHYLHEEGLVHRDVRPANLMLLPGGGVKVLCAGVSRALFDESAADPTAVLSDPDYTAPEQARDAGRADARADVYGLGCVLYHALAGRPPFADANPLRQMARHAAEPPRPVQELNPAVPEGLQQILGWMLAKGPAARYPTAARAAQALEVFLAADGGRPPAESTPSAEQERLDTHEYGTVPEGAALPGSAAPAEVNVELVEATPEQPPPQPPDRRGAGGGLGRRGLVFLLVGFAVGGLLLAGLVAVGLLWWLRRRRPAEEEEQP
jgi:serine/threonine protein kinase